MKIYNNNKTKRALVMALMLGSTPAWADQLADDDFVYDANAHSGQWQYRFGSSLLSGKNKQSFDHWVGFHSINPTLVLALIEMQSGAISKPTKQSMQQPFGRLSNEQGFSAQLNDVLSRLAKQFYQVRQYQTTQAKQQGSKVFTQTAATEALLLLLSYGQQTNQKIDKALGQQQLNRLVMVHRQLFDDKPLNFGPQVQTEYAFNKDENKAINIGLQLPWSRGYSWVGGGSHGYDGSSWPHSSIDYAYDWPSWGGQTWSVRSAHGGTVSVLSSCQVRITHASGWATTYYHMSGVNVSNGQQVGANHHLGYYASNKSQALCEGGSSTGPHLHFSLLKNGYYHSLDDVSLSHYVVNTGRYSYDSNCSYFYYNDNNNGGRRFCGWNSMYNY